MDAVFTMALAAYNFIRLPRLLGSHYMKGKWRFIELPGYEPDYAGMVELAYTVPAIARDRATAKIYRWRDSTMNAYSEQAGPEQRIPIYPLLGGVPSRNRSLFARL